MLFIIIIKRQCIERYNKENIAISNFQKKTQLLWSFLRKKCDACSHGVCTTPHDLNEH